MHIACMNEKIRRASRSRQSQLSMFDGQPVERTAKLVFTTALFPESRRKDKRKFLLFWQQWFILLMYVNSVGHGPRKPAFAAEVHPVPGAAAGEWD